ncbi:MAG TPA: cohesin domain-containing protein, partial [Candidatus Dormibacteraeota bacterium]|nr:cohesin domain-containing protein [Candidatus Dormibacteraeota bacterium]
AQAATCPAGAACLAIVPASQTAASAGSTLKLNVSFVNFPTFAGWDISVKTNNAVLSPTSITLVETFGGTASTFSNCVNGAGSGCGANDGAGVAHSAAASLGASDAGNGVLFTIAYNAIANGVTSVTYVASSVSDPAGASVVDCTATPNQCVTGSVTVGAAAPSLISVVTGTDGNLYWSPFTGTWGAWSSLGGQSPSSPSLCVSSSTSTELVVRGTDNGIYHKTFSAGTFSAAWDRNPTGVTIDKPACAVIGTTLYVVVRGATNEIWATTFDLTAHTWAASWTDLNGFSPSAPALAATPSASRLDLVVRGVDNQIYHKAFTGGAWAAAWDTSNRLPVPDKTIGTPAIVSDGSSTLHVVVIGTEANLWYATLTFAGVWSTYTSLAGSTPSTPSLVIDSAGALHLVVQGQDNAVYAKSKPSGGAWDATWTTAGGQVSGTPAVAMQGTTVSVVVKGIDSRLWYNTLTGTTWSGYVSMNGAATVAPGLSPP